MNVPKGEDEGWLFISSTGGRMDEGNFLRGLKKIIRWAGLPEQLNNHSQRRFSLNRLVKASPKAAKDIAGHKSMDTTMIYTEVDNDYNKEVHDRVGILRGLLTSNRTVKRRRLV